MNIEYRKLTENDIGIYHQIRLECLQKNPDFFGTRYEDELKAKTLKFDAALKEENSDNFLLGAFQANHLLGICGFTREDRPKTLHRGNISHMYVKEELAGKGIGTKLLVSTLDKAFVDKTLEQISLGVVNTNEKAIGIYRRIGFVQFGFLENYFKKDDKYWGLIFMSLNREKYISS